MVTAKTARAGIDQTERVAGQTRAVARRGADERVGGTAILAGESLHVMAFETVPARVPAMAVVISVAATHHAWATRHSEPSAMPSKMRNSR